MTQGSLAGSATLGSGTESRWDYGWPRPGCAGTPPRPGGFFLIKFLAGAKSNLENAKPMKIQTADHKMVGLCPKCKSEVVEGNSTFFCWSRECGFKFGKVIMGQILDSSQATKLLRDRRSDLLPNFVSKAGKRFSARLVLDESGKVTFDFPKQESQEKPTPPKPIAEQPAVLLKEKQEQQSKQEQAPLLASKTNDHQSIKKKGFITFKRCLISGFVACAVCYIGGGMDSSRSWFLIVPITGLPWLLFKISDNEKTGDQLEVGEAIATLIAGAFYSLLSGVPVLIGFAFLRSLFAS